MKFICIFALIFAVAIGVSGQESDSEVVTPTQSEPVTGEEAAVTTDVGQQPDKEAEPQTTAEPEPEPEGEPEPEPSSEPEPEPEPETEGKSKSESESKATSAKEDLTIQQSKKHETEVPASVVPHASKQQEEDSGSSSASSSISAVLVLAIVGFKLI